MLRYKLDYSENIVSSIGNGNDARIVQRFGDYSYEFAVTLDTKRNGPRSRNPNFELFSSFEDDITV